MSMGVYIKGMEMPCCCDECRFLDEYGDYPCCIITDEQRGYNFKTREKRMDNCPLVPAADVRPVRRGKWVDMGDFISCSSCNATRLKEFESDYGKVMRLDARANFCPNCGADMKEEG